MIQCFGNTILKWICILVFAFLVFIIVSTILAYQQGAFAYASTSASHEYNFVYCHNEVTNTTITYPEGTKCGEPNIDEDEIRDNKKVNKEEEEAMKEK